MHFIQTTADAQYDVDVYRAGPGRYIAFDRQTGEDITHLVNENKRLTLALTERMLISQVPSLPSPDMEAPVI